MPISCGNHHISITRNLDEILRQLRSPDSDRTLWADAVCIDQEKVVERAQQVQLMRTIFNNAKVVLICLGSDIHESGPEGPACKKIMLGIRELCKVSDEGGQKYHSMNYLIDQVRGAGMKGLPPIDSKPWEKLMRMFRRIWVIQEVAEASSRAKCLYGTTQINWIIIRLTVFWIMYGSGNSKIRALGARRGIRSAAFMTIRSRQIDSPNPALALFELTRDFEASDPRDKIFAMLDHPIEVEEHFLLDLRRPPSLRMLRLAAQLFTFSIILMVIWTIAWHAEYSGSPMVVPTVDWYHKDEDLTYEPGMFLVLILMAFSVAQVARAKLMVPDHRTNERRARIQGRTRNRFSTLPVNWWRYYTVKCIVLAMNVLICFLILSCSINSYQRGTKGRVAWDLETEYWVTQCRLDPECKIQAKERRRVDNFWSFFAVAWMCSAVLFWFTLPKPRGDTVSALSARNSKRKRWVACTASTLYGLEVDYSKSLEAVYRDVALAAIEYVANLDDCFSYVLQSPLKMRDQCAFFPSWVPRWDRGGSTAACLLSSITTEPYAAGSIDALYRQTPQIYSELYQLDVAVLEEESVLKVYGFRIDRIDKISYFSNNNIPYADLFLPLLGSLEYYNGDGSMLDAVTLTLTAGRDIDGRRVSNKAARSAFSLHLREVQPRLFEKLGLKGGSTFRRRRPWLPSLKRLLKERCYFSTPLGYVGL